MIISVLDTECWHEGVFEKDTIMFLLHISLEWSNPPIWRRIAVRNDLTLGSLHKVLQTLMEWQDSHLHLFRVANRCFGDPISELETKYEDVDYDDPGPNAAEIGSAAEVNSDYKATCIDGDRNSPPEDIGGIPFFEEFLRAIAAPDHPDHERYLAWVGGSFDAEEFDLGKVNLALSLL